MKNKIPYLVLVVVLVVVTLFFFLDRSSNLIQFPPANELNENWQWNNQAVDIPQTFDIEANETLTISHTLGESFEDSQMIMIRTSLQEIRFYLDNQLIYEATYGENLAKPYASMWHFISIPSHSDGLEIRLELTSPYASMSGQVNSILFGSETMLYAHLFRTYNVRLVSSLVIFLIGFGVMITSFFLSKTQDRGFAYTGLFAVLLSLWMFAETRMMQFFTGSTLLIGSLAYIALPLMPIPLLVYLKNYILLQYKKPLEVLRYIYIGHFLFVVLSYGLNLFDFFETVILSQLWLVVGIGIAIVLLVLETKKLQNNNALTFIKVLLVLSVFAAFEIIGFAFQDFQNTSVYLSLGLALIMIGLLFNYGRYILERMKISNEKEAYEKLAYMDYLTQGNNRLAFERDIEIIFKDPQRRAHLRLLLFDLDDLKSINDGYGHIIGDQAIRQAFDFIQSEFGSQGEVYRIGGDELACILENKDSDFYEQKKNALFQKISDFESLTPYHFGLSIGSAVVTQEITTSDELIHAADLEMYQFKQTHKKSKNTHYKVLDTLPHDSEM